VNSTEPTVWLNKQWRSLPDASIPVFDLGLWGLAATEMLRTYGGRAVLVDRHIDRLLDSARAMRFDNESAELPAKNRLKSLIEEAIERNQPLAGHDGDLGLSVCITAGVNSYLASGATDTQSGSVSIVPFKLPLVLFRERLQKGQHLVVSSVRQIPEGCLSGRIKSRSRLHWRLAEIDVRKRHADAVPVLLDENDRITETSTSNVFLVKGETVLTPATNVLRGITRAVVLELARQSGFNSREVDLTTADVVAADEVFTTSALLGLCPVSRFNGQSEASKVPGSVTRRLTEAFGQYVGIDIVRQLRNATN
jgi:branched-chain amino acid aminotransferase